MKAIMYHYVRPKCKTFSNLKYLEFNNFRKQLDFFYNEYGFVTREEFDEFITDKKLPRKSNKIILTFDDGFKDHYDYVFQELLSRNIFGIFYIPTAPLINKTVLDVHKIHFICNSIPDTKILNDLYGIVNETMIVKNRLNDFKDKLYQNQRNTNETRIIKEILNYYLSSKYKSNVISDLCSKYNVNYTANEVYLTIEQAKEMSSYGMIIGSHTHSHPVLSTLKREDQEIEINKSSNFLHQQINQNYKTMCFPYGGSHSYNKDSLNILKKNKFDFAFSVESRNIKKLDLTKKIFELPRYDCNEYKFGKSN